MTRVDQLALQVRQLGARLAQLEAATIAPIRRTGSRRKSAYVDIAPGAHWAHVRLWSYYQQLKRAECALWTVESFVARVTDAEGLRFNLREFIRWFADANTHAVGSRQDRRITAAVQAQIVAMVAAGVRIPRD